MQSCKLILKNPQKLFKKSKLKTFENNGKNFFEKQRSKNI